jgi:hypothetical protein
MKELIQLLKLLTSYQKTKEMKYNIFKGNQRVEFLCCFTQTGMTLTNGGYSFAARGVALAAGGGYCLLGRQALATTFLQMRLVQAPSSTKPVSEVTLNKVGQLSSR